MPAAIPFRPSLEPLLESGKRALRDNTADCDGVFSDAAQADLVDALAEVLSGLLTPLLLEWFLEHPGRSFFDPDSTSAHDEFVAQMAAGGLEAELARAPRLRQLVDHHRAAWLDRAVSVIERTRADQGLLADRFGVTTPITAARGLVATGWRLSDAAGAAVVYKHRPLRMQEAFHDLICWLNGLGPTLDLRAPLTVSTDAYGWSEDVAARPAEGDHERREFDRRAGMLAALLHVLGGGDMHKGNLRRDGGHPIVLDCEKILRPLWPGEDPMSPVALLTGLFPLTGHDEVTAHCGLATDHWRQRPARIAHIGSDAIRRRSIRTDVERIHEAFRLDVVGDRARKVEALIDGFTEVYRILQANPAPIDVFGGCDIRVMVRYATHYDDVMDRLLDVEVIRSADRYREVVGSLGAAPSSMAEFGDVRDRVLAAETRAVGRIERPRFTTPSDGREIWFEGELLGSPFELSALDKSALIVGQMSGDGLARGCAEIEASLSELVAGVAE